MSPTGRKLTLWALVLLALGLVFTAYSEPTLMVQLSEQLWACF